MRRHVSAIVLATFNVLLWYNVFTDDVWIPAARASIGVPVPTKILQDVAVPPLQENIGIPMRIQIPSIALDAAIEKVALAADGSMDVPKDPWDTAWYGLGPRPGETGSAAIAGHVDWVDGATAVFTDLHKVQSGDIITVQDDGGATITFVVREIRMYDAAAVATDVFISNDGKAHLNLITCDGVWDNDTKQYSKRLVVFADKE